LSEYNILYHAKQVWIIDVSQAVEYDHPKALDFLKKDCECISNFFQRKGVDNVMSVRQLFDFVTDIRISEEEVDACVEKIEKQLQERGGSQQRTSEEEIEEGVFKLSFIPRTLHEVRHPFAEDASMFHSAVTGTQQEEDDEDDEEYDSDEEEYDEEEDDQE
jgi:RIO kinase 1